MQNGEAAVRGALNGNSGNKSYEQKINEKFKKPLSEFDHEKMLQSITPRSHKKRQQIIDYLDYKILNTDVASPIHKAYTHWRVKMDVDKLDQNADDDFTREFQRWCLGVGSVAEHQKTPWGRKRIEDTEIKSYLMLFLNARLEFMRTLEMLYAKAKMGQLRGINEYYLFYKYLVRGGFEFRLNANGNPTFNDSDMADWLVDWRAWTNLLPRNPQENFTVPWDADQKHLGRITLGGTYEKMSTAPTRRRNTILTDDELYAQGMPAGVYKPNKAITGGILRMKSDENREQMLDPETLAEKVKMDVITQHDQNGGQGNQPVRAPPVRAPVTAPTGGISVVQIATPVAPPNPQILPPPQPVPYPALPAASAPSPSPQPPPAPSTTASSSSSTTTTTSTTAPAPAQPAPPPQPTGRPQIAKLPTLQSLTPRKPFKIKNQAYLSTAQPNTQANAPPQLNAPPPSSQPPPAPEKSQPQPVVPSSVDAINNLQLVTPLNQQERDYAIATADYINDLGLKGDMQKQGEEAKKNALQMINLSKNDRRKFTKDASDKIQKLAINIQSNHGGKTGSVTGFIEYFFYKLIQSGQMTNNRAMELTQNFFEHEPYMKYVAEQSNLQNSAISKITGHLQSPSTPAAPSSSSAPPPKVATQPIPFALPAPSSSSSSSSSNVPPPSSLVPSLTQQPQPNPQIAPPVKVTHFIKTPIIKVKTNPRMSTTAMYAQMAINNKKMDYNKITPRKALPAPSSSSSSSSSSSTASLKPKGGAFNPSLSQQPLIEEITTPLDAATDMNSSSSKSYSSAFLSKISHLDTYLSMHEKANGGGIEITADLMDALDDTLTSITDKDLDELSFYAPFTRMKYGSIINAIKARVTGNQFESNIAITKDDAKELFERVGFQFDDSLFDDYFSDLNLS